MVKTFIRIPLVLALLFLSTTLAIPSIFAYSSSDKDYRIDQEPIEEPDYDETPQSEIDKQEENGVCKSRKHEYTWYNTSDDSSTYKYYAVIHGFAVVLDSDPNYTPAEPGNPAENDFLTNVDTTTLLCMDGGIQKDSDASYEFTYQECGFEVENTGAVVYQGSEWGGTSVTYQTLGFIEGSPRGLLWQYGQESDEDVYEMPWLESGEWWQSGAISFDAKDYSIDMQTATSEGWVMVEFFEYNTKTKSWAHTYPIEVDANRDGQPDNSTWDPDDDYEFWWGIEAVNRSIWPACEGVVEENYCASLEITSPTVITAEQAQGIGTITLDVDNQEGNAWDGTYRIGGYDTSGALSSCRFSNSYSTLSSGGGSNPLTTSSETLYFADCEPSDQIVVVETNYSEVCRDSITIETEVTPEDMTCIEALEAARDTNPDGTPNTSTPGLWGYLYENAEGDLIAYVNNETSFSFPISVIAYIMQDTYDLSTQIYFDSETYEIPPQTIREYNVYTDLEEFNYPLSPICTYQVDLICGDEDDIIREGAPDYGEILIDAAIVEDQTFCVDQPAPYCGDGVLDTDGADNTPGNSDDEVCDDGNNTNGDGCSSTCQLEVQPAPYCGDSILDTDGADNTPGTSDDEVCDDGNTTSGDGCSATCDLEAAAACISLSLSPETTTSTTQVAFTITPNPSYWPGPYTWTTTNTGGQFIADNGVTTGNTITTTDLSVEYNGAVGDNITVYEATSYGSVCRDTATITSSGGGGSSGGGSSGGGSSGGGGSSNYCGDGIVQWPNDFGTYEECDDGNSVNDDGCSNVCQIEEVGPEEKACAYLEVIEPEDQMITSLPVTLNVQAFDDEGNEWSDPEGETYEWSTTGSGIFTDDFTSASRLETDENSVQYNGPRSETQVTITVEAGGSDTCREVFTMNLPERGPADKLEKGVNTYNFGFYEVGSSVINANGFSDPTYGHDFDYAFYELAYTPDPNRIANQVNITDSISDPISGVTIEGEETGEISFYTSENNDPTQVRCWVDGTPDGNGSDCGYEGSYRGFSVKDQNGNEIPLCTLEITDPCYTGEINSTNGIQLRNMNRAYDQSLEIHIRYLGKVDNGDEFSCTQADEDCPVLGFKNIAQVDGGRLEAEANVSIICPYLLTRNGGDVYFEDDPNAGYDLSCYYSEDDYSNSDGLVFRALIDSAQNSVCNDNDNKNLVNRFSSYVCEMMIDVENWIDRWSQETIVATQSENIAAISRYNDNLSHLTLENHTEWGTYYLVENFENLTEAFGVNKSNEKQNVYKVSNANLVFKLGSNQVPSGGYTFIVENGDLIIEDDITYQSIDMNLIGNLNEIPSIAFIVLGGNVRVDEDVQKMAGVYYLEKNTEGQGGAMTGDWTDPFTPLEIFGSVYGDITPLAEERTFSGPAQYDHGNVVIRYDERILLNPPPGLEEYVDIESERVAR